MNIVTLIQKVRDLIAAARAGDWLTALALVLDLIKEISGAFPTVLPAPGIRMSAMSPRSNAGALTALDAKSGDELCDELDELCNQNTPPVGASASVLAAPAGPFVTLLVPILLALLKKWLGF